MMSCSLDSAPNGFVKSSKMLMGSRMGVGFTSIREHELLAGNHDFSGPRDTFQPSTEERSEQSNPGPSWRGRRQSRPRRSASEGRMNLQNSLHDNHRQFGTLNKAYVAFPNCWSIFGLDMTQHFWMMAPNQAGTSSVPRWCWCCW